MTFLREWSLATISIICLSGCSYGPETVTIDDKYQAYCGSCHLAPDPGNIPKHIWQARLLPEMASRLGFKVDGYNPFAGSTLIENHHVRMSGVYPKKALLDSATWRELETYILSLAPDSMAIDVNRTTRNLPLDQFKVSELQLYSYGNSTVTSVSFDALTNNFLITDAYGFGHWWPESDQPDLGFNSPVTAFGRLEELPVFTSVGFMNPSQIPMGSVYRIGEKVDTLAIRLHRPIATEIVDLDGDGVVELIICEFGNHTGQLSLLYGEGSEYRKKTLLPVPGTIKVEIEDMNNDDLPDIVLLAAQGNEGVYILYNEGSLSFRPEHVLRLPPEHGSSWFELIDYNNDGFKDLVVVNGDNADYSIFHKDYHGIRLYVNDGENRFEAQWFYPIYGATRVSSADYDSDGDFDFAVMSYFPDFDNNPEESFVFLENLDSQAFQFEAYTAEESVKGRWLVMEKGDVDQDGDLDLLLGSYLRSPGGAYRPLMEMWRDSKVDFLYLENTYGDD